MGRRYYCDYCDKSFLHTPEATKKHLNSLQHLKLKNEYYLQFKDKRTIIKNESNKLPCKYFMESGYCAFGVNCRFTHYTAYQLNILRQEVEQQTARRGLSSLCRDSDLTFEGWLLDRKRKGLPNSKLLEEEFIDVISKSKDVDLTKCLKWNRPCELESVTDLPHSLRKLKLSNFNSVHSEWG